jgi:photosystem II stability/assembly factor-like uncharacterized protein
MHRLVGCVAGFVGLLAVLLSANGAIAQDAAIADPEPNSAEQQFYRERANAQGVIPPGVRHRAMEQLRQIRTPDDDRLHWTFIGPMPTVYAPGMPFKRDEASPYNGSPTSGRVTALAVDPRDANTVYLGAAEGGVWKTTDGGAHWQPIFDFEDSLAIGSIAIDPQNPDTVYVGTGDDQDNAFGISFYGDGIYKSIDGGATWRHTQNQLAGVSPGAISINSFTFGDRGWRIVSLAVSPSDRHVVLAGVQASVVEDFAPEPDLGSGIFRSDDGGEHWRRMLAGQGPAQVVFDPTNGNIAYAMIPFDPNTELAEVYKSSDGGQTWSLSFSTDFIGGVFSTIAIAPNTPTTVYALLDGGIRAFVAKTVDGGQSWTKPTDPGILCNSLGLGAACAGGRPVIAVDPRNPDIVAAAYQEYIFRSTDGGVNWTIANRDSQFPYKTQTHTDHHALVFSADGSVLYDGNDGGADSTTNIGASDASLVAWTELNDTLGITQFYRGLSLDPNNINLAFGGTQDNGAQKYSGSLAWTWIDFGDAGPTAIDDTHRRAYLMEADAGLGPILFVDSTDDDGSILFQPSILPIDQPVLPDDADILPAFIMDPNDTTRLYFVARHVWQSSDEGLSWQSISPGCPAVVLFTCKQRAIAIAPSDPNTLYTAMDGFVPNAVLQNYQLMTRDALAGTGSHWSVMSSPALPPRFVSSIAVHPTIPTTAYFAFSGFSFGSDSLGHVFKTADAGNTWTDISGQLPDAPVNAIVIDPDRPTTLYIGTDIGVFRTTDDGRNWHPLKGGMPNVTVTDLKFHHATRTLRAATHGRGMWDLVVPVD